MRKRFLFFRKIHENSLLRCIICWLNAIIFIMLHPLSAGRFKVIIFDFMKKEP